MTACSDDEKYDVYGNPDNLIYFSMSDISNPRTFSIAKTPVGNFGGFTTQYPVFCTRMMSKESTVKAIVDNTLVSEYNQQHNTSHAAVPDGVVNLSRAAAHFHSNTIASYDSLTVEVSDANLGALTEESYLLPIRLSEVQGDGKGSEERGVLYIVMNLTEKIVNERASVDDLRGSQIPLQTMESWTESSGQQISKLTDGERTTNWSRGTYTIDMQTEHKVSGLKLLTRYANGTFSQGMKLELSSDNTVWTEIGTLATMPRDADDYQCFVLYGGITARYLRITYGTTMLSELRVYEQ